MSLLGIFDPLLNESHQQNEQELTGTFIIPLLENGNNSMSSKPCQVTDFHPRDHLGW